MKNNSGQSLVEVLIGLAMTVLLLTALVIATTQAIKNSRFARAQSKATHLAQEQVEELRNIRDEEGWGDFKSHLSSCPVALPVGSGFSCEIKEKVFIPVVNPNEIKFTVAVSWEDKGKHEVRQTTTLTKWAY